MPPLPTWLRILGAIGITWTLTTFDIKRLRILVFYVRAERVNLMSRTDVQSCEADWYSYAGENGVTEGDVKEVT